MKYAIEMVSIGMIYSYIPSFMMIDSGTQVMLRLLPQQFDKLQIFMKYVIEMASGSMIFIQSFINISSDIQKLLGRGYTCRHTDIYRQPGDLTRLLFFQNKEIRLK
jgi:uncharacterized UPF0160 family protein